MSLPTLWIISGSYSIRNDWANYRFSWLIEMSMSPVEDTVTKRVTLTLSDIDVIYSMGWMNHPRSGDPGETRWAMLLSQRRSEKGTNRPDINTWYQQLANQRWNRQRFKMIMEDGVFRLQVLCWCCYGDRLGASIAHISITDLWFLINFSFYGITGFVIACEQLISFQELMRCTSLINKFLIFLIELMYILIFFD